MSAPLLSRRRLSALLALTALAAAMPPSRAQAPARRVLCLQPLGDELPQEDVALVVSALTGIYGLDVRVLPRAPLPRAAYYPPRARYRAERLLDFLAQRLPPDAVRVLGLTAVDISTTKGRIYDWGVMGLGRLPGTEGVISSYRCRRGARGALHARERLAKVAVHEIGHTLGLDHCTTPGCLMHDAEGKVATVDGEFDLCATCRAQLKLGGRALPEARIPWRKP